MRTVIVIAVILVETVIYLVVHIRSVVVGEIAVVVAQSEQTEQELASDQRAAGAGTQEKQCVHLCSPSFVRRERTAPKSIL